MFKLLAGLLVFISPSLAVAGGAPPIVGLAPAGTPLSYLDQGSILVTATVGTSSTLLVAAGTIGRQLKFCALPSQTANVWLNLAGGPAVPNMGMPISAYGGCTDWMPPPTGAVSGVSDGASPVTITAVGG